MEPSVSVGEGKKKANNNTETMVASSSSSSSSSCYATYRDHSHIRDDDKELNALMDKADAEGVKGTDQTFPVKLHQLLSGSDEDGFSHIVSWQAHGRSFIVKKHSEFVEKVLPCCFRQSKFASFQRQLNLYGFRRITQGRDKGGYFHELFLRGRTLLALKMQRTKVKGTGARKASSPETEPDFYAMPFVYETNDNKKPTPTLSSPPAASLPAPPPAPSAAMSPSAAAAATLRVPPSMAMSPLVASPLLASRRGSLRLEQLTSSLINTTPPTFDGIGSKPESLARAALRGLDKPSSSLGRLPSIPSSRFNPSSSISSSIFGATSSSLPPPRHEMMSEILAARARFEALRDAPRLSTATTLGGLSAASSSLLPSLTSTNQRGPLHLNALGVPCNCALPAF